MTMRSYPKRILWICTLMVLMGGFFIPVPGAEELKPIVLAWEPWEPYQYLNDRGELTGLGVDMLNAILLNMKAPYKWQETPWKRVLKDLEEGFLDAGLGASKTPEREQWAYFSDPYRTESVVLFVKKGSSANYAFQNLRDIIGADFKLGVARGYYYGETYDELATNVEFQKNIEEVKVNENLYKMLIKDRIDGFLADPVSGTAGLKTLGFFTQVEIHPMQVYSDNIHIMFSKKRVTPEYVRKFNQSLAEIKVNGVYNIILNKYLR
ncbi:MAG: amino acid ABC transporter substrate-binding protein [Desulfobacteraceae bacterium]|nr:amino acid ABC transporter substrate-binding protein [Desulfobacteraceae bacterium]